MAAIKVNIGHTVSGTTLKIACKRAAEDLGWELNEEDRYREEFGLGSLHIQRKYESTRFKLSGFILPAMQVLLYERGDTDYFWALSGVVGGVALPYEVRRYLSAVSDHLHS